MGKKWEKLANLQMKIPPGYSGFSINTQNYLLLKNNASNASKLAIPMLSAPAQLVPSMKELFNRQEQERYKLRQQHLIEAVSSPYLSHPAAIDSCCGNTLVEYPCAGAHGST